MQAQLVRNPKSKTAPVPPGGGKGAVMVLGLRTLDMGVVVRDSGLPSPNRSNTGGQSSVISGQPAVGGRSTNDGHARGGLRNNLQTCLALYAPLGSRRALPAESRTLAVSIIVSSY